MTTPEQNQNQPQEPKPQAAPNGAIVQAHDQRAHIAINDKGLAPDSFDGMFRVAVMIVRSGFAPKGMDKPEQVMIALAHGAEIGLRAMQSIQSIAVVDGRPSIYGDAALALVESSGLLEDIQESIEGEGEDMTAVCITKRKDRSPRRTEFSMRDAQKAGLAGKSGPWTQYPKRMLQMRARGFNLRDNFPDVLKGLTTVEEAQDRLVIDVDAVEGGRAPKKGREAVAEAAAKTRRKEADRADAGAAVDLETGEVLDQAPNAAVDAPEVAGEPEGQVADGAPRDAAEPSAAEPDPAPVTAHVAPKPQAASKTRARAGSLL